MKRINWEMDKGRTLTWLAEELGLGLSHVSRLVKGERSWTEENLEKAGRALGVMAGDLLVEVERCEVCKGYGTLPVREGGKRFVVTCDACDGEGCVPTFAVEPEAVDGTLKWAKPHPLARIEEREAAEAAGGGEWEDD